MSGSFVTGFQSSKKPNKHKLFCRLPFTEVSILPNGDVTPTCCPDWVEFPFGNILKQSWDEIWNGKEARALRESAIDGSLRHCSSGWCPWLQSADAGIPNSHVYRHEELPLALTELPVLKAYLSKSTKVSVLPKVVNLIYDRSCNLRCPSCRDEILKLNREEQDILQKIHGVVTSEIVKSAEILSMGGTGDPLASPVIREFLVNLKKEDHPNLKVIGLQTNAQLFTPRLWDSMKGIQQLECLSVEVSIDAATSDTYDIVRPPGKWNVLMDNIRFIKGINNLSMMIISFVVQESNYREMIQFIELGRYLASFGKNVPVKVMFYQIRSWGQFTESGYLTKQVQNPEHPEHKNFLSVLKEVDELRKLHVKDHPRFSIEHNFPPELVESYLVES